MALATVNGTAKSPSGEPWPGAQVVIRLAPTGYKIGQVASDGFTMVGPSIVEADEDGEWSIELQPTEDIFSGPVYEVFITARYGETSPKVRFTVPAGGPHRFEGLISATDFGYGGY